MTNFKLRISNLFLILFILLIPTQLGRHFWPEWSLVGGVRSDYLSPTLYLIDIIWILLVVFNFKMNRHMGLFLRKYWWLGVFVLINIMFAGNWQVAIYKWGRILQWVITAKLITNYESRITNYLRWIIPIWIGVESLLGVAQLVNGGSLQGMWYWLGERRFELTTPGIAQMAVLGRGLVRAYGTFSHPNSLAGFLLIAIIFWNRNQQFQISNVKFQMEKILFWVVNWLAVLGIIISGSRTVWLLGMFLITNYELRITNWKQKIGYLAVFGGVSLLILAMVGQNYQLSDFVGGWDKDGWNKRQELNMAAGKMIFDNPLFGIGAGNFVAELPKYNLGYGKINWWQPVHNAPLLIISEIGILGLALVISNLIKNRNSWWIIGIILITGMVDHYWLTLPQNMWLLAVTLGMTAKIRNDEKVDNKYRVANR